MAHANARLTVHGRALLVERVLAGHRPADVAHQMGCSRATAYWVAAPLPGGGPSRARPDRSGRPRHCPHRTPAGIEQAIPRARRAHRAGADWLGAELGIAPSSVGRVLRRHRMPRLSELDALTGQPVRRRPVMVLSTDARRLVHIDVKWADLTAEAARRAARQGAERSALQPSTQAMFSLRAIMGVHNGRRWFTGLPGAVTVLPPPGITHARAGDVKPNLPSYQPRRYEIA